MHSIADLIVHVYCIVDDLMKKCLVGRRLRQRGFAPALRDSEVVTMEIVGEFLGHDTDSGIHAYFREHWLAWFPALGSRTTFLRQAANLWWAKQQAQQELARQVGAAQDDLHIVDGLPIPVCTYTRASRVRCFKGAAAFGYCASKDEHFYGFKGHPVISSEGFIVGFAVAPANTDERVAAWESLGGVRGTLLGDKGYISAQFQQELRGKDIGLRTPVRRNMAPTETPGELHALGRIRRLVETVNSQLAERFHIQRVRARDLLHLTSRIARKILAHTVCACISRSLGHDPLHLSSLLPM
jgi:hypothetical protein